jgi:hypothetical protein
MRRICGRSSQENYCHQKFEFGEITFEGCTFEHCLFMKKEKLD